MSPIGEIPRNLYYFQNKKERIEFHETLEEMFGSRYDCRDGSGTGCLWR